MTENHSDLKAVRSHESNTPSYIQPGWMCAETCTTQKHRRKEEKKKKVRKRGTDRKKIPAKKILSKIQSQQEEERETTVLASEYKASQSLLAPFSTIFFSPHIKIAISLEYFVTSWAKSIFKWQ